MAYEIEDIEATLIEYAGDDFASEFFNRYIYNSEMPDYKNLFGSVGIKLERKENNYFGASVKETKNGLEISRNIFKESPAYKAGLTSGDILTSIDEKPIQTKEEFEKTIKNSNSNSVKVNFERFGEQKTTEVKLGENPAYTISLDEEASKEALKNRENWLEAK